MNQHASHQESSGTDPRTVARRLAPWELIVLGSGAVALIGSFLPFFTFVDVPGIPDQTWNAWSNALSLFPVSALVVAYVVAGAGQLALTRFTETTFPERVAGFSWRDLRLLLGALATLTMAAYLLRSFADTGIARGAGLYLSTLGALGLLVGSAMEPTQGARGAATDTQPVSESTRQSGGGRQASRGDLVIIGAGAALVIASFLTLYTTQGEAESAWAEGFFPLFVVPAVVGAALALHVALATFTTVGVPGRILGVEAGQAYLPLGGHAALMMLGFLLGEPLFAVEGESIPDPDRGVGFWIMLLAAGGLVVGVLLREREASAGSADGVRTQAPAEGSGTATVASGAPPPAAAPPPGPPTASERLDGPGREGPPRAEGDGSSERSAGEPASGEPPPRR